MLQWDVATVHIKDSSNFLGQSDLTKREMREVVMQTSEPASTREATTGLYHYDKNYSFSAPKFQLHFKCQSKSVATLQYFGLPSLERDSCNINGLLIRE